MAQFGRSASVIIGFDEQTGLRLDDLRITFNVSKNNGKKPNKGKVEIWNLAQSTRDAIRDVGEKLFINAGYTQGDGEQAIFVGDITSVQHIVSSPNVRTVIEAQDGKKAIDKTFSLSVGTGGSANTVLNRILSTFDNPSNIKELTIPVKEWANGWAYNGNSVDALTRVTDFLGLDWSFQNDVLTLIKKDTSDGRRAVRVSPETGLINSPVRQTVEIQKAKGLSKKTRPGWEFNTLLNPKIVPNGQISLESKFIPDSGIFKVFSVTHQGDNWEGDFITKGVVTE